MAEIEQKNMLGKFKHFYFIAFLFAIVIFIVNVTINVVSSNNRQEKISPVIKTAEAEIFSPTITPVVPSSTLLLLFVGDIMLDRTVFIKTKKANDYNFPFLKIADFLKNFDLRVANLEGPITDFKSVANGIGANRLIFTFSPQFLEPLKQNFDILNLANNHTNNFGAKGLQQTRDYLDSAGSKYFGDPNNSAGYLATSTEFNGIKLGFVGFNELAKNGFENVLLKIKELRPQVDFLIAYPHWGNEYESKKPSAKQQQEAHALIDTGADAIIGSHPHVVQPTEEYNGKIIFYSLGNFIFDQYFSGETMQGLAVGVKLEKRSGANASASYQMYPLQINNDSQPALAGMEKYGKISL